MLSRDFGAAEMIFKINLTLCYTFRKDYFIILDMDYLAYHERQLAFDGYGLSNPMSV